LDDGRLTDGQGRVVNFRNTVIVMTSNVGTSYIKRSGAVGFSGMHSRDNDTARSHKQIDEALKQTFRPEFINRIDEIIIFEPLSEEQVIEIVDLQLKEIQARLAEYELSIVLTQAAKEWMAREGYDKDFGARPLRRALQRFVESPLSVKMLKGEVEKGDVILVDEQNDEIVFVRQSRDAEAAEETALPELIPA
jgi:ATP-dependent Clp protease ATP-binding subunit ClpC